ncbi:MAG: hypothetical protein EBS60_04805 [Verrucomicrobia bacterium]|jgi:hypothetical protein|nr:hypothetical protein [Verrucomicrobiota bacterium]
MKQQMARIMQMLVVVMVALFVGAPQASAGTKWDRCVNRMNSRGDKVPDAKGRHCWDTDDDDDEEEDDDKCGDSKKSCGGKKSCRDKDDDDKK